MINWLLLLFFIVFTNASYVSSHNLSAIKYISKDSPAWHLSTPTVGILAQSGSNAYLPYNFTLWELAPKKGAGIRLVLLDTGIAAFQIAGEPRYKHHESLHYAYTTNENYNCSSQGLRWFTYTIKKFLQSTADPLEDELIPLIKEYCFYKSTESLVLFLKKYGRADLFDASGNITAQGNEALFTITEGRKGIMPYGKIRFFTPIVLQKPYQQREILEFLPTSISYNDPFQNAIASHGTHIFGLITSIAPKVSCVMIKACNDEGISDAKTLQYALKKSVHCKPDILTLSLKIERNSYDDLLGDILKKFEYVVVASGNENQQQKSQEAYPACLPSIPFDVGALYYENDKYGICSFSQYEKSCGPKFVAPGYNIVSTCIPCARGDYLILHGTSMAAALISGFVALMLGEFKKYFTREQLLKVCYSSGVKLNTTAEWHDKCLLGALDMRTALCLLHICRAVQEVFGKSVFDEKCDAFIMAIKTIMNYNAMPTYNANRYFKNLSTACHYYVSLVRSALNKRKTALVPYQLFEQIVEIMHRPSVDLFESYDIKMRERLLAAINHA